MLAIGLCETSMLVACKADVKGTRPAMVCRVHVALACKVATLATVWDTVWDTVWAMGAKV